MSEARPAEALFPPDTSGKPGLTLDRRIAASPEKIYRAWTDRFEQWFAKPGGAIWRPSVNEPYFFVVFPETGGRYTHYGRFLRLEPPRLVEFTWVTETTKGAETVVTVNITPSENGTLVQLAHSGFPDEESKDAYAGGWKSVLEELATAMA